MRTGTPLAAMLFGSSSARAGAKRSPASGALLGLLLGSAAGAPVLALGMTGIYGLLRVYEPPGMRAEILFAVLAALSVLLGGVVAGRERRGPLAFVQLVLLATAATAFGKAGMTEVQSYFAQEEPSALTLVLLLVGLPLAGVAAGRAAGAAPPPNRPRLR